MSIEEQAAEGPLAHAARVASEEAHLAGLAGMHRAAWERASGGRPETVSKRVMVALSHAIEKAVMSGPVEEPTVVVSLFQRLPFFDRERAVYERMAAAGLDVVVAFVEGEEHTPPRGVHVVRLHPDEPLADEWTVVAAGPRAGCFLVATDQHHFDPDERAYEASRQFDGRWGFAGTQAATELARLRFALGDRLEVDLARRIDGLLSRIMPAGGQPAASAGTPGETWASTLLFQMLDRMQTARAGTREMREQLADAQGAAAARSAATTDPQSGLPAPDFLRRWSRPQGGTTTLPTGLVLVDVPGLEDPALRDDPRAGYHAARRVAAALTEPLGPVDAAVRLDERQFLVVVPGASPRHIAAIADDVGAGLELASGGYPGVALRATTASIVTRTRPLPIDDLHEALFRLDPDQAGPIDAGRTPAGDRIVVASTVLHSEPPARPYARPAEPMAPGAPSLHDEPPLLDEPASLDHHREQRGRAGDDRDVPLPRRQAQQAWNHISYGDGPGGPGGGPSVFTDLSPN